MEAVMAKRKAYKSITDALRVNGDESNVQSTATIHPVNNTNSAIYYKIDLIKREVETTDGLMVEVKMKFVGKNENLNPDWDVAAVVGIVVNDDNRISVNRPEIVFWDDKLWIKATDKVGVEYYGKNKTYLLYEVGVVNQAMLFENIQV
jgi:hypothetical protein